MVAPAVVAGIQAGASIFSSITGGKGAKKAANIAAQSAAADRAQAQQIYNQNVGYAQPTVDRGNAAGAQINALLGLGGDTGAANDALASWRAGTGYQDRLAQGMKAVNTGYAARGVLESGAAQKALLRLGAEQAGQSFSQYVDVLQGQRSAGLGALGSLTGSGASYQSAISAANGIAASAQAGAALYGAQARQDAFGGIARAAGDYFGRSSYPQPNALPASVLPGGQFGAGGILAINSGPYALSRNPFG